MIFSLFISACQNLPHTPHLQKSQTLTQKRATNLSKLTAKPVDDALIRAISLDKIQHPNLSGYFPIITGADAFATRSILTNLASKSIDVQYYIWHDDEAGQLMLKDLYTAANRGVMVRLLLDDLNTNPRLDQQLLAFAEHPNIAVRLMNPKSYRKFPPLNYANLSQWARFQRRMHNKSITFDDQIAIIGGRNIGDEYLRSDKPTQFADLDVMLVGKVVGKVDDSFEQYWQSPMAYDIQTLVKPKKNSPTPTTLQPKIPFLQTLDKIAPIHNTQPQSSASVYEKAIHDSTIDTDILANRVPFRWTTIDFLSDDVEKLQNKATPQSYLVYKMREIMGEPQQQFTLISSYFVPDKQGVAELVALAKKGVKIKILTNSFSATDVGIVHSGYSEIRKPLLQAGIEIYELKTSAKIAYPLSIVLPKAADDKPSPAKHPFFTKFTKKIGKTPSKLQKNANFPKSTSNKKPNSLATTVAKKPSPLFPKTDPADKRPSLSRANITTSLHTKAFAVDNDKVFIGSYNVDPRSANINTELGVVIYDPQLAQKLHNAVGESLLAQAYQVTLDNNGNLQWTTADHAEPPAITQTLIEPKMSLVNQIWIKTFSFLPIKWLL